MVFTLVNAEKAWQPSAPSLRRSRVKVLREHVWKCWSKKATPHSLNFGGHESSSIPSVSRCNLAFFCKIYAFRLLSPVVVADGQGSWCCDTLIQILSRGPPFSTLPRLAEPFHTSSGRQSRARQLSAVRGLSRATAGV
jgi:hypothetical protein